MKFFPVDLHSHSTASDGLLSPTALVALAARQAMHAIALTDHDTTDGLDEALAAGQKHDLIVVPGVEFSTRHEKPKGFVGIHLLGYFIDHHHPALKEAVEKVKAGRLEQKIKQIERLQSFGFDIPVAAVLATATGVPGRPHIAAVLMERNPGYFESIQQVFDEYLGAHKKAHVGRSFAITVGEAVELIHNTGGLSVLAHPGLYLSDNNDLDLETLIKNAVNEGVKGIEVHYPYTKARDSQALVAQIGAIADKLGLFKTGGTDYHARPGETVQLGEVGLSLADLEKIDPKNIASAS